LFLSFLTKYKHNGLPRQARDKGERKLSSKRFTQRVVWRAENDPEAVPVALESAAAAQHVRLLPESLPASAVATSPVGSAAARAAADSILVELAPGAHRFSIEL
jgi:hypothetical protein